MSARFLFVLRGRPGLGHVIPGYALATWLRANGGDVRIATYRCGSAFLQRAGWNEWVDIPVPASYSDWPGLHPYDHGLRVLGAMCAEYQPDVVIHGGEYLLGVLTSALGASCGMIFNAEIFEDSPRNRVYAEFFATQLEACDFLIPLWPPGDGPLVAEYRRLSSKLLPPGPFAPDRSRPPGGDERGMGIRVLIANGGGIDFPERSDSYSSSSVDPRRWVTQTEEMTLAAIDGALGSSRREDRVVVASALGAEWNESVARRLRSEATFEVFPPSPRYYEELHEADIVVSRAGAGFLADVEQIGAAVVVWSLEGHDEQRGNAGNLSGRRPHVFVCDDVEAVRRHVAALVSDRHRREESLAKRGTAENLGRTGRRLLEKAVRPQEEAI